MANKQVLKAKRYGYFDMMALAFRACPGYSLFFLVQHLITALIPTFNIYVTARFVDTAIDIVQGGAERREIILPIALLLLIMIYNVLLTRLMNMVSLRASQKFKVRICGEVLEKRAKLQYHYIENPKMLDLINRVSTDTSGQVLSMYLNLLSIVEILISSLGVIITLASEVWYVGLLFVLLLPPTVAIAVKGGRATYKGNVEMTNIDRRNEALSHVMLSRENVEERTVFGFTDELNQRHTEGYEYARKFRMRIDFKNFFRNKLGGFACTTLAILTMFTLLPPVSQQEIEVGMFIALVEAVLMLANNYSGGRKGGINGTVETMIKKREFLRELTTFMALEEEPEATCLPDHDFDFGKIEFKNVGFAYPGVERTILNGLSFTIEHGKHYSFVGANGAGKTTIIKLLTGLYSNYTGEILVDGIELRALSPEKRKGLCAVVYQDFARYPLTMRENILLGNIQRMDASDTDGEIMDVANTVGLEQTIAGLHHGLDTPLGKIFEGGADISGGQWQRLAMARAMINPAPLCILDEPTSALDPLSESRLYEEFGTISHGRTTIFISHRLGSTKLADTIYVIEDGKISEAGSHAELMKLGGSYRAMFEAQAAWYTDEKEVG